MTTGQDQAVPPGRVSEAMTVRSRGQIPTFGGIMADQGLGVTPPRVLAIHAVDVTFSTPFSSGRGT